MKDISIVIAHRGDPMGLWATIHSCTSQLDWIGNQTKYDYEFCICVNGEETTPDSLRDRETKTLHRDTDRLFEMLRKHGTLGSLHVFQEGVSAPTSRQIATTSAQGKYLFFFDNHCLVDRDYFRRTILDFESRGMDMVHSMTRFYSGDDPHYHYKLHLNTNFWAESVLIPEDPMRPYKIAAAGHGGFAVTAESWREVGGYWDGFEGYAGEELTTDLQYWMRGKSVYIDPLVMHYHWAGNRPYARHFTDDYYKNLMMSAHIIGGEKYLWKVYEHFTKCTKSLSPNSMYDLLESAYYKSKKEADRLASCRQMDLDQLQVFFRENLIAT